MGCELSKETLLNHALPLGVGDGHSLAEKSLDECVPGANEKSENGSSLREWKVFNDERERSRFIKSVILVLSGNGSKDIANSQIDIFYNHVGEEYRATLAVMSGTTVKDAIISTHLASDKRGAFVFLMIQVEERLDALLRNTVADQTATRLPYKPCSTSSMQSRPSSTVATSTPTSPNKVPPMGMIAPTLDPHNSSRRGPQQPQLRHTARLRPRSMTQTGPNITSSHQHSVTNAFVLSSSVAGPSRPRAKTNQSTSSHASRGTMHAAPLHQLHPLPQVPQQYIRQQEEMIMQGSPTNADAATVLSPRQAMKRRATTTASAPPSASTTPVSAAASPHRRIVEDPNRKSQ